MENKVMEDVKFINLIGKYFLGNMSFFEKKEFMFWVEFDIIN